MEFEAEADTFLERMISIFFVVGEVRHMLKSMIKYVSLIVNKIWLECSYLLYSYINRWIHEVILLFVLVISNKYSFC